MKVNFSNMKILAVLLGLCLVTLACSLPGIGVQPATSTPFPGPTSVGATDVPPGSTAVPTTSEPAPAEPPTQVGPAQAVVYLVALEDAGKSGPAIGCGDSIIAVTQNVPAGSEPVRAALEALFALQGQYFGESGLYNALWQSNLTVMNVSVDSNGAANVSLAGTFLLGGTCDSPRFQEQIEQTVLSVPGVTSASITINGVPLEQALSQK